MSTSKTREIGLVDGLAMSAGLNKDEFRNTLLNTVMPGGVTEAQLTAFLMVAEKYDLNPITKEIYAFPSKGGINPIVSIDGWLKIINSNPQFDGMEFIDDIVDGTLFSVTCKIFRKDRGHHTAVTEYMGECKDKTGKSIPWKNWPARMLRHKATIQAARYAFGLSGIVDEDEAKRIKYSEDSKVSYDSDNIQPDPEPAKKEQDVLKDYPDSRFQKNKPIWEERIITGKDTAQTIIDSISEKYELSENQINKINQLNPIDQGDL